MTSIRAAAAASSRLPRILFVNDNHAMRRPDGSYGFATSVFHVYVSRLPGVEAVLSSPVRGREGNREIVIDGVRVLPRQTYESMARFVLLAPVLLPLYFFRFLRLFRKFDLVVIVTPSGAGLAAYLAARMTGVPAAQYVVADVLHAASVIPRNPMLKAVAVPVGRLYRRIDLLIAARYPTFVLSRRLWADYERHACDLRLAITSTLEKKDLRAPTDDRPERLNLVSVSRADAEKGLDLAIEAIASLRDEPWLGTYFIVGDGPSRPSLEQLVQERGLEGRVVFLGRLPHAEIMAGVLQRSDVFLLPSRADTMPKAIIEAMGQGLLVIGTDVGGVPEVIGEKSERGILIPPEDVGALVAAIENAHRDWETTMRRRHAGHAFASSVTTEAVSRRLVDQLCAMCRPARAAGERSDEAAPG